MIETMVVDGRDKRLIKQLNAIPRNFLSRIVDPWDGKRGPPVRLLRCQRRGQGVLLSSGSPASYEAHMAYVSAVLISRTDPHRAMQFIAASIWGATLVTEAEHDAWRSAGSLDGREYWTYLCSQEEPNLIWVIWDKTGADLSEEAVDEIWIAADIDTERRRFGNALCVRRPMSYAFSTGPTKEQFY